MVVLAGIVGFGPALVAPPVSAAPARIPAITVTPFEDLHGGDQVLVRGRGFSSSAQIGVAQCAAGAADPGGCDLSTSVVVNSDGKGRWSAVVTVRAVIHTANTDRLVCSREPGACIIGSANLSDFGEAAGQPLEFGGR
jgi:hypothetical protein